MSRTQFEGVEGIEQVDAIVTPTMPTPAFKIGEKSGDPLQMYLSDIFTLSCNLAGLPGLSVPCGTGAHGLPVGLQLIGGYFDEARMLQVAHQYQQATGWHRKAPPGYGA